MSDHTLKSNQDLIARIDELFHPRSVAVVGAPRGMKTGSIFLLALLELGFSGPMYPVNPRARGNQRAQSLPQGGGRYPRTRWIWPSSWCPTGILRGRQGMCGQRGQGAVLFTAGYRETGTAEGQALEEELVRLARSAGMRLIGPNGMGLYCPKSGLSFFPGVSREPGPVGIVSHSGSLTNILGRMASRRGIRFSKVISSGNECDLTAADFLTYLGRDPETGLIGGYIEGIKDGPYFLRPLKEASLHKPVILWKVGLTPEGSRASASTLVPGRVPKVWQAVERQTGTIPVTGFEAWVDTLMGFSLLPGPRSKHGGYSGPGGLAVSAAEACGNEGLTLASLSRQTQSRLADFVPATGTSLRNPVDVSLTAHFDLTIFKRSAETVAQDPGVDALVIIGGGLTPEDSQIYVRHMIAFQQEYRKPLLMVTIPGHDSNPGEQFCQAGIPFFDSAERALKTYALAFLRYQQWRRELANE